jgi:hypothetical protein
MPKKIVPIKYTSREFDSIKSSLIDYAKRYYPETFRDFSEASFGSLLLDTVAYVGDILSFYLDYQANESFLDTATEYDNILKLGKQLGYKFRGSPSSYGLCTFYILCPSDISGTRPDINYMPILKKRSQFSSSSGGTTFMLDEDVHFDHPSNEIRVARVNELTGVPTAYAIKSYGRVVSGAINSEYISVSSFKKFLKLTLSDNNVAEIISVTDSEGHEYYEVEYLSQDVIYKSVTNRNEDRHEAGEVIKPFHVARRFVTERNKNKMELTFGASSDLEIDVINNNVNISVVDPSNVVLRRHGAPYITDDSFDPHKLVESDEFGVAPSNTTLHIIYRTNTSNNINLSTGSLNKVMLPYFEFKNTNQLNKNEMNAVMRTLECINEEPIVGKVSLPTSDELKIRILNSFSTQNRAVTAKDYEAIAYAMPPKFGSVKRCKVYKDLDSLKRNLNMYVISEAANVVLHRTNDTIKENLKTWLSNSKMVNDTIDIMDAKIINLSIKYEILGRNDMEKFEILQACNTALKQFYAKHPEIGEPFFITDVYSVLKNIEGVIDVINVNMSTRTGGKYSDTRFNLRANTSPDGRYINIPKNCIWEIKYLSEDINGVIK